MNAQSFGSSQKDSLQSNRIVNMHFDEVHQDFGVVKKGEKRKTQFEFTNKGNEALEIEIVSGCECTTLDWPRKPIQPGEKGTIDVIFDSSKKEESETVEIDINLKNKDPKTGYGMLKIISYSYILEE